MVRADRLHLVIGYGNELRGDDGAGCRIGRTVESWDLPGTRVIVAHQLTPELAADLAEARFATFVDVYPAQRLPAPVELYPVRPADETATDPHVSRPDRLLALARTAYGRHPAGWVLAVPAYVFDLGETMSSRTESAIAQALATLKIHLEVLAEAPDHEVMA